MRAVLLVCALLAAAACGSGPRQTGAGEPLSCLLITLDTTKADELGFLGGPDVFSPHLDALAAESVVYERAHTVAPMTLPSHASMLTGLYPPRHSVHDNGLTALPGAVDTVAERLRAEGYQTAAFLAAIVLEAAYGLDQGFDVYETPRSGVGRSVAEFVERDGHSVTGLALEWLRNRDRERPFFLWAHYFDPHAPHEPSARFGRQARGDLYGGEIATMDDAVGILLDQLRRDGTLEETLVVVVADHGEALGLHGEPTHSLLCYEEVIRVPFLVRYPSSFGEVRRSREPVSVVDVFPTLLEAAGLDPNPEIDGQSLFLREVPPDRGKYFESYTGFLNYGWGPLVGWLDGEHKYIHGTTPELYDLTRDPKEARNLLESPKSNRAPDVEPFRQAIRALGERPRYEPEELATTGPERVEMLQALGYAGGADSATLIPPLLEETGLPDPRKRIAQMKRFYRATGLIREQKPDEAIEVLRAVLVENPGSTYARIVLGTVLNNTGRPEEAEEVLRGINPPATARYDVLDLMGHALEDQGRLAEALEYFRLCQELKPSIEHPAVDVARVEEALGNGSQK